MPYNRFSRRSTKKHLRRMKPRKPLRYEVADMAYKGYKLATAIASTINTEYKFFDIENNANPTTTGSLQYLNLVDQGDTSITRDGATARMKSLAMKWRAVQHASATNTFLRVLLFIETQPSGVTAGIADILQSVSTLSPREMLTRGNFIILKDWHVSLDSTADTSAYKEFYREIDLKTLWDGTGAGIADLERGAIGVVFLSNEATNAPGVDFFSRVRFVDN